jgi:hypothetical protein
MAQSGHCRRRDRCLLLGVKRTSAELRETLQSLTAPCAATLPSSRTTLRIRASSRLARRLPEKIMDFAPFVEGDLPQRLISGLRQIDARMLDVRWWPAATARELAKRNF